MHLLARHDLEDRLFTAVQGLCMVGDRRYLQTLSRAAFLDALDHELRFVGFYTPREADLRPTIHAFLERHVDQWQVDLRYMPAAPGTASPPLHARRTHMPPSPLLCAIDTAPSLLPLVPTTHFFHAADLHGTHF